MYTLHDTRRLGKFMDHLAGFVSAFIGADQFNLCADRYVHFGVLVNVTVCMTGNGNGLGPGGNIGRNPLYNDGRTEYGTVKDGADGSVG